MKTRLLLALLFTLFSIAVLGPAARADIVYLKNGNKIRGRVVSEEGGVVVVQMPNGVVRIPRGDVLYIKREKPEETLATDLRALVEAGRSEDALARLEGEAGVLTEERARGLRAEVLRAEARRMEKALRLAEAYGLLVEALTLTPGDEELARAAARLARKLEGLRDLVKRARLSAKAEEFAEAAALFEKALALAPESRTVLAREVADAYERLGDAALSKDEPASAGWYEKAMKTDPARAEKVKERYVHAKLLPVLGRLKEGELDEARRTLDAIVEFAPGDSQARYVYGRLLEAKRDWQGASYNYLLALPEKGWPRTAPAATREGAAELRKRVESRLGKIHDEAAASRREREERARVEEGAAKRLKGRFFVVHTRNTRLGREVLEAADAFAGRALAALGLGRAPPWEEPCPVYLMPDENTFLTSTGQPQWSGGLSHCESVDGKLVRQYLTVFQTCPRLLKTTVPHEVMHLVFSAATKYAPGIPLAVHEGFAVSREPGYGGRDDARHGRGILIWKRLAGELIPLSKLFEMKDVGVDPTTFYAQSASVVDFLVKRKGAPTFLRFAADVAERGIARALRTHYGFEDAEALEREWRSLLDG